LSDSENEFASDNSDEDNETSKKRKKKKSKKDNSGSDNYDSDKENGEKSSKKSKSEKSKSRKIWKDEKLSESTKQAEIDEKERKERLEELRNSRKATQGKTTEFETRNWNGILNKDPLIEVDSELRSNLKSHQIDGLEFMWDSVIESVTKEGDEYKLGTSQAGHGCILGNI
jgi:transcriptional regulator ATRX